MIFVFTPFVNTFLIANLLLETASPEGGVLLRWFSPVLIFLGIVLFFTHIRHHKIIVSICTAIFASEIMISILSDLASGKLLWFTIAGEDQIQMGFFQRNLVTTICTMIFLNFIYIFIFVNYSNHKGICATIYAFSTAFVQRKFFKHLVGTQNTTFLVFLLQIAYFIFLLISYIKIPLLYYITIVQTVIFLLITIAIEFIFKLNWKFCENIAVDTCFNKEFNKPSILPFIICFLAVFVIVKLETSKLKKGKQFERLKKEAIY